MIFSIHLMTNAIIEKIAMLQMLSGGCFSKPSPANLNFEILSPIIALFFSIRIIPMIGFENPICMKLLKALIFSITSVPNRCL